MDNSGYLTMKVLMQIPKRSRFSITDLETFEDGFSARLWTNVQKNTVRRWLKLAGITDYRLQYIVGTRINWYRLEFIPIANDFRNPDTASVNPDNL